jgi:hypothetical protein
MSGPVALPETDPTDPNGAAVEAAREARDRMPITAAMGRFGFSDAIWSHLQGVAFVSVHAAATAEVDTQTPRDAGILMCVAFPVDDVASFATMADAWGLSFAKGETGADAAMLHRDSDAAAIPIDAVRAIEIHASEVPPPSHGAGPVGARGAIAWTFAPAAGQDGSSLSRRGWWIVCAQTGDVRAQDVVARAQSLARDASSPGDASGDIVFRFMSRPALMRQVTGARALAQTKSANAATLGAALANRVRHEASGALDTLDRVETVIRRRPTFNELFDGTISIQMRPTP